MDFGTTNSYIGFYDNKLKSHIIPSDEGKYAFPSVISFDNNMNYVVGWRALSLTPRPEFKTIHNIKRLLGSSKPISIMGEELLPEVISSLIILSIKKSAEEYLGRKINEFIISAPSNFSALQANMLVRAYQLAGINVKRIIGEPCAAGMARFDACGTKHTDNIELVIDMGGGTLDVAVLVYNSIDGEYAIEPLGVVGSNELGGADYDAAMVSCITGKLGNLDYSQLNPTDQQKIVNEAIRAKIDLSYNNETSVVLQDVIISEFKEITRHVTISRSEYKKYIASLDGIVKNSIHQVVKESGINISNISNIILAGQGTKVFTIKEIIRAIFGLDKIIEEYQEFAVTRGLSYSSGILSGNLKNLLLVDSTYRKILLYSENINFSYRGGKVTNKFILVDRNTTIPATCSCYGKIYNNDAGYIEVREQDMLNPEKYDVVKIIRFKSKAEEVYKFTIDIDANKTMFLSICDNKNKVLRNIQLNNQYVVSIQRKGS